MTKQYTLNDFQRLQNPPQGGATMANHLQILEIHIYPWCSSLLPVFSIAEVRSTNSRQARDQKAFDIEEISREIMDTQM